ncbi:tRNA-dihydrouridine(20) synthase [NAD(P)+]-like [Mya arenaria]|uniref:tRNA-dihydrouridine(20) synthase [NAD(P)+]-like n=1 Tax=Mya arenaria TaxID=6604 RepID=UPI0022E8385B|nr:tRNA-dihydrouridine(20) synthase [NAD(P)+]-like [Mya arenaria]
MEKLDYQNKVILAPMVRIGTLPTRLLALKYGADIVYTEEIIDRKLLTTKRVENKVLRTVDYVCSDSTVVFRTHPSEKSRLVFQIGTANAHIALQAAKKIENDVAAIDVNMGCPKEFSLKGGMGAALLKKPETIKQILTTLVQGLSVPVTCKIRLQPEMKDNISLVKMIESTGVSALGIHGRLTEERPRHPNRNDTIKSLAQLLSIPVIANGGSKEILNHEDIAKFKEATGASSVMIARAAEWNTSIFRKQGILPVKDVVKEYLKIAIEMDNDFPNTKYCILNLMHVNMDQKEGLDTQVAKCIQEISEIWGLQDFYDSVLLDRKSRQETVDHFLGIKKRKTEDGKPLIEMPMRFIKKDYPTGISPKQMVYMWTVKHEKDKAVFETAERSEDRCYKSIMKLDGAKYTASFWEKSKQLAEQAAAIVGLTVLGEEDGRKTDVTSPNDDIAEAWSRHFRSSDIDVTYSHKDMKKRMTLSDSSNGVYIDNDSFKVDRNEGDQDSTCVDSVYPSLGS